MTYGIEWNSKPSKGEEIEKLIRTNAELKEHISDEVVERIEEEVKASRGD